MLRNISVTALVHYPNTFYVQKRANFTPKKYKESLNYCEDMSVEGWGHCGVLTQWEKRNKYDHTFKSTIVLIFYNDLI